MNALTLRNSARAVIVAAGLLLATHGESSRSMRFPDCTSDGGEIHTFSQNGKNTPPYPYPTWPARANDAAAARKKPAQEDGREHGTVRTFATILNERELADDNLQFVSRHYDLVLLAFPFPEVVARLRQGNPDLIILLFNNPYFAFGERFWRPGCDKNLEEIAGDWLLRDESGAVIRYNGPLYGGLDFEQRVPLLDIRAGEWQEYYASQSRKWVSEANMDGLFIDTLGEHLPHFARGPGGRLPAAFTPRKWRESAYTLLREVKQALAGTDALLCFNGISRGVDARHEKPNWGLLSQCDGTAVEAFGITMGMDHSNQAKRWFFFETILQDVRLASENGKLVLIEIYAERPTKAHRRYALCSFLLVQNERTYFYYTSLGGAGSTRWRPEWSLDLGHPAGTYRQRNGMYFRRFEKATVWVNPQPETRVSPLAVAQIDPAGNRVNRLMLAPFSGTLLFSPNKEDDH